MSYSTFNKENLDTILKELAKEYRRLGGKQQPAEIILVGGAAVLEGYKFRDVTSDIDAMIYAASTMKEAARRVEDKFDLPSDWINDCFRRTGSYSNTIREISKLYKTFYGVLDVSVVTGEYLVAMKIRSGRKYKNDLSDIVGILYEQQDRGQEISFEAIDKAMNKLYGGWDGVDNETMLMVQSLLDNNSHEITYSKTREQEKEAKRMLVEFEYKYPNEVNMDNVNAVLEALRNKKKQ